MGVLGLWELLESVGHPVKIEGLEGKVLGVDANIWLYKFIRGYREKDNATNIESHKLGLFNRICKLLFYRIKPVFVFDGPAPVLKRRTLERRQNIRNKHLMKHQDAAMKILANQLKLQYPDAKIDHLKITMPNLISNNLVAAEKLTDEDRDLFYLPETGKLKADDDSEQDESDDSDYIDIGSYGASAKVDIHSKDFVQLPAEMRYEILQDVKLSSKRIRNSSNLPEDANSFSNFQLERLRARRTVQQKIEECEKEICTNYTGELADGTSIQAFRVQSDAQATILYRPSTYDPNAGSNQTAAESSKSIQPTSSSSHDSNSKIGLVASEIMSATSNEPKVAAAKRVTNKIVEDAKELLRSSGITYIDLAGETKAQGAKLKDPSLIELSDSDDGDSWPSEVQDVSSCSSNEDKHAMQHKMKILDNQLKSQYPDAIVDQLSTTTPDLSPNNVAAAAAGKLTDEDRDLFHLPETENLKTDDDSESDESDDLEIINNDTDSSGTIVDIHSEDSVELQAEIRSEILRDVELRPEQTRNSLNLPEDASSCSNPPLEGLKDKRIVQQEIEECEKVICSNHSGELADGTPSQASRVQSDSQETIPYCPSIHTPVASSDQSAAESSELLKLTSSSSHDSNSKSGVMASEIMFTTSNEPKVAAAKRVTNKIVEDAKELLRLFGIPYIDAAGEAEAQCAKLEELKLTEGTITDDSDIWLFGSQNVFRYFFNEDKYVMQYKMTDIEFHLGMTRENLVCLAMMVGSDYTDGIMNIGSVTALEVLSEFPGSGLDPLIQFRDWHKKALEDLKAAKKDVKRRKLLKFKLSDEFPSRVVYEGYLKPVADTSTESFVWGMPELDELREYARRNFGWDPKKVDEKLVPVMKKLNEKKVQKTIDTFFFKTQANRNPELFRSKRVNQALNRIAKRAAREAPKPALDETIVLSEEDDD